MDVNDWDTKDIEKLDLIYCGGGNKLFADIAIRNGFRYGSRLPGTPYYPIYFADQNYKLPNLETYIKSIQKYKPYIATVLDWEKEEQYDEIMNWCEKLIPYIEILIIIPKIHHSIHKLPKVISGKEIRLGYSVPTTYGGTDVMLQEFIGWPVHLLGGSPNKQIELSYYLDVKSADGNMAMKMASHYCAFYEPNGRKYPKGHWPNLKDASIPIVGNGAIYRAFELSCKNIMRAWQEILI